MANQLLKVYLIPGLGADARMFQLLHLDADRFETVILEWLPPLKKESLEQYAARMAAQIPVTSDPFILAGVSFGGMIAIEISKLRQPALTILISSIKTINELPAPLRFLGRLGFHHYLPMNWSKKWRWPFEWIFGAKTDIEKKLLGEIIRATDVAFVKWAFTAIVNWQNTAFIPNLVHLHGNQDKIFPLKKTKPPIVYPGSHLIIFSAAEQISDYIREAADRI